VVAVLVVVLEVGFPCVLTDVVLVVDVVDVVVGGAGFPCFFIFATVAAVQAPVASPCFRWAGTAFTLTLIDTNGCVSDPVR
jgi:hypothetical protein